MNRNKTRGLREGAMMVALTIILVLLTWYVPLFSLIGTFACAVPMACLAARNGFKVVVPAIFAVFVISILMIGSVISALSIVLMSVLPGAVAGYFLGKKAPFFITLFATCGMVCAAWILELVVIDLFMAGNGIEEMMSEFTGQMKEAMKIFTEKMPQNATEGVDLNVLTTTLIENLVSVFRLYFPSIVVISSMIIGYIIIAISAFVLKRTKVKDVEFLSFSMLKAPRSMSTVAVILYIAYILLGTKTVIGGVFANAVFILYTIIGICGLSVVDSMLSKKIKSGVLRIAIYFAIFMFGGVLMSIIPFGLVIVGMFDSTHNFRGLEYENDNI